MFQDMQNVFVVYPNGRVRRGITRVAPGASLMRVFDPDDFYVFHHAEVADGSACEAYTENAQVYPETDPAARAKYDAFRDAIDRRAGLHDFADDAPDEQIAKVLAFIETLRKG